MASKDFGRRACTCGLVLQPIALTAYCLARLFLPQPRSVVEVSVVVAVAGNAMFWLGQYRLMATYATFWQYPWHLLGWCMIVGGTAVGLVMATLATVWIGALVGVGLVAAGIAAVAFLPE